MLKFRIPTGKSSGVVDLNSSMTTFMFGRLREPSAIGCELRELSAWVFWSTSGMLAYYYYEFAYILNVEIVAVCCPCGFNSSLLINADLKKLTA